jgi:hypothetical protein
MVFLASKLTPAEKVTTLAAILLQTGKIEDISEATSIPARTVEDCRYRPAREGWLHISGPMRGRGVSRIYKPGLPGNPAPVLFDISIDWKPALQYVRSVLENYGNPAKNYGPARIFEAENYGNPAKNYGEKLRETDPITILNYTVLGEDGAPTTNPKALAQAANQIKDHLLALDQWDVIANPGAHAGLLHSGQIQTWLESGADPHRDIIPTVKAKLAQLHSQRKRQYVKSWDFFTRPIAEAKAKRERGLPPVTISNVGGPTNGKFAANSRADRQERDPLAHLTPEQRAKVEAHAKAKANGGGNHA